MPQAGKPELSCEGRGVSARSTRFRQPIAWAMEYADQPVRTRCSAASEVACFVRNLYRSQKSRSAGAVCTICTGGSVFPEELELALRMRIPSPSWFWGFYPRRRRGGGSVGIAAGDFQGLWEGWDKRLHRFFHAFRQTVSCTALSRLLPLQLTLRRARGMHALAVVPKQPCKHCVFGLPKVRKRSPYSCSTFSDPNSVSVTALSRQLPLRLIEGRMPCWSSTWRKSSLAY